MTLQKLNGHTYFYSAPTNIGVIRYKNAMTMLIDAGIDSTAGRALAGALESEGLKPKYAILTHSHPDHYGALKWLKEQYTGLISYATELESIRMAHPHFQGELLYGASPLRPLASRYLKGPKVEIDTLISEGLLEIGDKKYEILALPGHSFGHIGVLTSDSVLFLGDALFSEETMSKYGFPYLADVGQQLETIKRIAQTGAEFYVLSHAEKVYTSIDTLCEANKHRIEFFCEQILEWCNQPLTREDVAEQIIQTTAMETDVRQYFLTLATTGAFLSYLADKEQLSFEVIAGKCYYFRE